MTERTLILIKPDAVARRLTGKIIARLEEKGLWLAGMKMLTATAELADRHYAEHLAKPFYPGLRSFIISAPLVAMVVEGPDAIALVRKMLGATKVLDAVPGTIRGDYAVSTQQNLVHASDSPESAARELAIWFTPAELTSTKPCDGKWLHEAMA